MMGFDLSSIKTSNLLVGSYNILNDASSAVKTVCLSGNDRRESLSRYLSTNINLNRFFDSVTYSRVYDYSCLPSFVVSKSCVVIVSVVTLSADASKYSNVVFEDLVYPKVQSSMGSSSLFLSAMNNSHSLEVLYLGKGDIVLPSENLNQSQQSAVLIGSIVGSVVVGLVFIFLTVWIIYKRSRRPASVKQGIDSDDFQLIEDPDTPFMILSSSVSRERYDTTSSPPHNPSQLSSSSTIKSPCTVIRTPLVNDPSNDLILPTMTPSRQILSISTTDDHVDNTMSNNADDTDPQEEDDDNEYQNIRVRIHADSIASEDMVSSISAESDFLARIKSLSTKDDSLSVHESDASSIDDEMIQTLESLIRVDDWQGILPLDVGMTGSRYGLGVGYDHLSISSNGDEEGMSHVQQSSSTTTTALSKEEIQSLLRAGEWDKLSKSSKSLTGLSNSGLSMTGSTPR